MKLIHIATLCVVFIIVAAAQCVTRMMQPATNQPSLLPLTACGSEIDLTEDIRVLSTDNWAEAVRIREALLQHATQSNHCRTEIISAFIQSMNKPELNFITDRQSYFLWLNGSILLGRLKAVEALDLLINHLDLNDGSFSASMSHQPAVLGVTAMGSPAVPKLTAALKENPNRNIRLAAALCLTGIGGDSLVPTMKDVLRSEPDACVRHFLEVSVELSTLEGVAQSRPSNKQEAALIDLRRQLLIAMRCGN
ncbi:MAG TPA: HEAT repeat domain-containing protein [Pyrinomonadaceae bacterium]